VSGRCEGLKSMRIENRLSGEFNVSGRKDTEGGLIDF